MAALARRSASSSLSGTACAISVRRSSERPSAWGISHTTGGTGLSPSVQFAPYLGPDTVDCVCVSVDAFCTDGRGSPSASETGSSCRAPGTSEALDQAAAEGWRAYDREPGEA